MSIYNRKRVRELVEEQLEKDLHIHNEQLNNISLELTNAEFENFWCVFQISEHSNTSDFFKDWSFYLSDNVVDDILFEEDALKQMYCEPYDFTIEECLEEAKSERLIKGFFELSDDLWLINDK